MNPKTVKKQNSEKLKQHNDEILNKWWESIVGCVKFPKFNQISNSVVSKRDLNINTITYMNLNKINKNKK